MEASSLVDTIVLRPHICHFLYTGRIFKFKILHLKLTKIYPKKSKICSFFAFNLEKYTPDRIFYTGSARGARDKYEVCLIHACIYDRANFVMDGRTNKAILRVGY